MLYDKQTEPRHVSRLFYPPVRNILLKGVNALRVSMWHVITTDYCLVGLCATNLLRHKQDDNTTYQTSVLTYSLIKTVFYFIEYSLTDVN